jgi:hypothetical protein
MSRRFAAKAGSIVVRLPADERQFLSQILRLLSDVGAFDDDPAARRLNVPVYLDAPEANQEWWRLMGEELGASRDSDRSVFARVMGSDEEVTLSVADADAFLRVLNEGRLAFAARLGLDVEEDRILLPDPERQALDHMGWVLEELTAELSRSL